MNLSRLARDQVSRAGDRIRDARRVSEEERWADAVRFAQEGVELALKGLLRSLAIEVPKRHDVGPILQEASDRLPLSLRAKLPAIVGLSRELAGRRALAMYGDEIGGRTPDELFGNRDEAGQLLARAEEVVNLVSAALRVRLRPRSRDKRSP